MPRSEIITGANFARLVALNEGIEPAEFVLGAEPCTIGRSSSCQIVLPGSLVSRLHATVERSGPRYLLRDMGSVNGTFVNGRRVDQPLILANDDLIGLGTTVAQLRFLDPDPTLPAHGRLRYDERALAFWLGDRELALTRTQFRLLFHLYRNIGAVCSREDCARAIWGREYDPGMDAGALDQALNSLRRVLRDADPAADLIQTRRGLGYELAP